MKIHLVDGTVATALSVHVPTLGGTLHFFAFETCNVHKLLRFIREHWAQHSNPSHRHIRATGGGSYKYAATFRDEIDVTLARLDEMKCTVAGLNFLLTSVDNEVYTYEPSPSVKGHGVPKPDLRRDRRFVDSNQRPFPYLLVNIGSGVSIVKVTDHDCYERISGSSLGGGTFWGLARLLLNCKTFDDIISLTNTGDNANVDMLVGDIYGGSYPSLGLDASVIAASFGKATMRSHDFSNQTPRRYRCATKQQQEGSTTWGRLRQRFVNAVYGSADLWLSFLSDVPIVGSVLRALGVCESDADGGHNKPTYCAAQQKKRIYGRQHDDMMVSTAEGDHKFKPQDVALSLLRMVSYNIGQIAYLNARVHGLDRIYFGGNFIRDHPYTIADISFSVDFWSAGKMKALFLRHDGYLGAIGAFIGASSAAPRRIIEEEEEIKEEETMKKIDAQGGLDTDVGQDVGEGGVVKEDGGDSDRSDVNGDVDRVDGTKGNLGDKHGHNGYTNGNADIGNDEREGEGNGQEKEKEKEKQETIMNRVGSPSSGDGTTQRVHENGNGDGTVGAELKAKGHGQSKSRRKRGAARNRPSSGMSDGAQHVKKTGSTVAVGSGTALIIKDNDVGDDDGWTTVRTRRRGGGSANGNDN